MKKIIIALLAAFGVCAGTATGATVYANQADVVARNAVSGAIEELMAREEIEPIMNMLTEGSLSVNAKMDMDEFFEETYGEIPSGEEMNMMALLMTDAEAGVKIYFAEDGLFVENLYAKVGDKVDVKADAYLGEDLIYVKNEEFLDGAWGIVRGEMADKFADSVFATDMGMPTKTIEVIETLLEMYDEGVDKDLREDIAKYYEDYMKVFVKSLEKHASYEKETDEVKVGGERIEARVITVTVDAEAAYNIVFDLYEELSQDKKLRETVIEYGEYLEENLSDMTNDEYDNIADLYDEFIEKMGDEVDDMEDMIDESEEEFIAEIVTPKLSSSLMKLTLTVKDDEGKNQLLTVDFGKDGVKDSNKIAVELKGTTVVYEIDENTSSEYSSKLSVEMGDEKTTLFKLSIDKKADEFKLTIPEGDTTVSGTWETKSKTTTVTCNKIRANGISVEDFEISVVINQKDEMPSTGGDVTNVFELDMEDFETVAKKFTEKFGFAGSTEKAPDDNDYGDGDNGNYEEGSSPNVGAGGDFVYEE